MRVSSFCATIIAQVLTDRQGLGANDPWDSKKKIRSG